jgi:hypothetical protein
MKSPKPKKPTAKKKKSWAELKPLIDAEVERQGQALALIEERNRMIEKDIATAREYREWSRAEGTKQTALLEKIVTLLQRGNPNTTDL